MDSELEVIDAFVDGERVDSTALKAVLASEAGRDYFVDAWVLRESVQEENDAAMASGRRTAAMSARTSPARRTVGRWLIPVALAAGVAGGYVAGYRQTGATDPATSQPPVTTVASSPTPAAAPVFPVPTPTQVIQLEFRADSADANRSGGD